MRKKVIKKDEDNYLNDVMLIDYMDIDFIPLEKLKGQHKKLIMGLGEIEVRINYYKQQKFKLDKTAQSNIIILKDKKRYLSKIKDRVEQRIREKLK